jgi:hypothetical protein
MQGVSNIFMSASREKDSRCFSGIVCSSASLSMTQYMNTILQYVVGVGVGIRDHYFDILCVTRLRTQYLSASRERHLGSERASNLIAAGSFRR